MEIKRKAAQILRIAMLACTLLSGIAILLAVFTQYDNGSAYFMTDAWLPTVAVSLALLGGVAGTVGAIFTPAESFSASPFRGNLPSPAAVGALAASLLMLWSYLAQGRATVDLIMALLLALTAVYALLSSLSRFREQHGTALVYLGFLAVLCGMLIAVVCYFDMSVEMNAPAKVLTQTALLIYVVYLTAEIRYLLRAPLPRLLLSLLSWLAPISALSVLSVLPLLYLGELSGMTYAAASALLLGVLVTVPLRMHALRKTPTSLSAEEAEGTETEEAEEETAPDTPTDDANGEDLT